ncbi:MAG TPA: hypothetical protein VHR45_20770 [Thermoanaerobaculia bacterium]|nr:hypothetical protein [Thermoanaerobaculia bacterium]
MLVFKSPTEERAVLGAIERLRKLGLSPADYSDDVANHLAAAQDLPDEGGQPERHNKIAIRFPFCFDERTLTFVEFVQFVDDLESATIIDNIECRSKRSLLLRVEASNPVQTLALLQAVEKSPWGIFAAGSHFDDLEISLALSGGVTLFGACVVLSGDYDEWFPPVLPEDLFVTAMASVKPDQEVLRQAVNAYVFELSSSAKVDLVRAPRRYIRADVDVGFKALPRLRPLLSGTQTARVLALYVEAMETADNVLKVLRFTRLFEYAALTMLRQELNERVKAKLESARVLQPDSDYVDELRLLFREFGGGRRQREAVELVVARCCDPDELARVAPKALKVLRQRTARVRRLHDFAAMLIATRNKAAHGGNDASENRRACPSNELATFAACVQMAAQQVIRWYGRE